MRTDRAFGSGWCWHVDSACPVHGEGHRDDVLERIGRWAWGTQGDSRVRPAHAALEGREFADGERHPTEGEPGDAYGCRCFKIPLPERFGGREGMGSEQFEAVERVSKRAKVEGLKTAAKFQARRAKARAAARGDSSPHELDVRLDRSTLRETPKGWLVRGVAGAGDQLLDYPEYGRTEWRSLAELEAAAPTLLHCPITIEHEVKSVDRDNWQDVSHGHVTDWEIRDKLLHFEALITTRRGFEAITQDGLTKLSLAYSLDPQAAKTPITLPDGRRAGGAQRGITFDNLTLTDTPRAGEIAALRLDKAPTMKRFKFTATRTDRLGKLRTIVGMLPALMLAGLEAEAKRTDSTRTDDELAVGKLSVEKSDGTKVDLVLPDGMLGDVLAMIGAGDGAPAEPAAEPDPAAAAEEAMTSDMEGDPEELLEEEEEEPAAAKTDSKRGDSRKAKAEAAKRTDARVTAALRTDAFRRDIEAQARPLFGSRPLAQLDAPGIIAAAVRAARCDSSKISRAVALAKAVRTDKSPEARGRALGQLEGMLADALEKHRTDAADVERQRIDSAPMGAAAFGREFFTAKEYAPEDEQRTDSVRDARKAMVERRTDAIKRPGKAPRRAAA
jgi:hypothetical protein